MYPLLICQLCDIKSRGMPWSQTGETQYHAQLGVPDKGRANKGLVHCNDKDPEPFDLLLNGLVTNPVP